MSEEKKTEVQYTEGSPWFWKIFGGAIIGVVSFLLLAHINNINQSIIASKNEYSSLLKDLKEDIKSNRELINGTRERLTAVEQNTVKDRLVALEKSREEQGNKVISLETSLKDLLAKLEAIDVNYKTMNEQFQARNEKIASIETAIEHMRGEIKTLREENKTTGK